MRGTRLKSIVYSIVTGIFAVFLFLLFYFAANRNVAPFMLILREVFPLYEDGVTSVFSLYAYGGDADAHALAPETYVFEDGAGLITEPAFESPTPYMEEYSQLDAGSLEGEGSESEPYPDIIGIKNVIYQPETDISMSGDLQDELLVRSDLRVSDFDYIKSRLYTVDKRTELLPSDIDIDSFLSADFRIDGKTPGPKVLIFHTHSQEAYADSIEGDISDGVFAAGERLKELLETKYGIEALHDKSSYDIVDGKSSTLGAYERMEPSVRDILNKNPSVELVIDMHRDGVPEHLRLVTNVNGRPTARLMFFNGLCRIYQNGELTNIEGLPNSYVNDNLALSLNLQLMANELFPGLTRKIYINAYRYSLHFKPKSILVEVGAQTNTKQEALNAMEPLAEILAKTIK